MITNEYLMITDEYLMITDEYLMITDELLLHFMKNGQFRMNGCNLFC